MNHILGLGDVRRKESMAWGPLQELRAGVVTEHGAWHDMKNLGSTSKSYEVWLLPMHSLQCIRVFLVLYALSSSYGSPVILKSLSMK